jgi:hypothetical protein
VRTAAVLLLVAVAVAAAIGANFVLLGYGRGTEDPVGRLSPRLTGVTAGGGAALTPTAPQSGDDHGHGRDDD